MNVVKRIKIFCEEVYAETVWCKQLLNNLIIDLKKRRVFFDIVYQKENISFGETVYAVGVSEEWLNTVIANCNELEIVPIIFLPRKMNSIQGEYHEIYPDIQNAVEQLRNKIILSGRSNVALYGINESVILEKSRMECFLGLISHTEDIYKNVGGLENCFQSFLPSAGKYDIIICVNGYAAVSLVKKLYKEKPDILENVVVVTLEEVLKNSKYNQWILNIDFNLDKYGKTALQLGDIFALSNQGVSTSVRLKCNVCEIPPKHENIVKSENKTVELLNDPEIILMKKIEQLLLDADDLDHHIIAMLLDGAKYSDIADSCYMTESNIKYRIKKYMNISGCTTKKELIALLQEYLR